MASGSVPVIQQIAITPDGRQIPITMPMPHMTLQMMQNPALLQQQFQVAKPADAYRNARIQLQNLLCTLLLQESLEIERARSLDIHTGGGEIPLE